MKNVILLLAFVFMASAPTARAQESAAHWVKKLGSGSYPEREKAARMLEKLGKAALPALVEAAGQADLETRRRAVLLMERIENNLAAEQVLAATPIALRFKGELAGAALRQAGAQMGLPHGARTGEDFLINLETGSVPYWRAWRQFCAAAKLTESDWSAATAKLRRMEGSPEDIRFIKQNEEHDVMLGRALAVGRPPIAFAAEPAAAYAEDDRSSVRVRVKWHGLDRTLGGSEPSAIFAVELRPEPRLELFTVPQVEITKIVDADGKERKVEAVPLFAPQADMRATLLMSVFSGEIQYGGLLHLKAISWQGPARPLKELHGRVRLEALTRATLLEVPGVLKAEGKEVRGLGRVTLKILQADIAEDPSVATDAAPQGGAQVVRVRLRLDNLESLAPQTDEQKVVRVRPGLLAVRGAIDIAVERLKLRDAKGWLHLALAKTEYKETGMGGYDVSIYFVAPAGRPEDFGLVMTKEARTVTVEMPFQVRDVAAPVAPGK